LAIASLLSATASPAASQEGTTPVLDGPDYPRLANVYLHGAVNPADIPLLARWDLLVLDSVWTDEQLAQIRALNPDIKIFFYTCPYCINVPVAPNDTWRQENYEYAATHDLWWRNADRSIASDWPGVQMANLTELCPSGPQGTWSEFIAGRVRWLTATRPSLDGIFDTSRVAVGSRAASCNSIRLQPDAQPCWLR
jgi:hypothetical protein